MQLGIAIVARFQKCLVVNRIKKDLGVSRMTLLVKMLFSFPYISNLEPENLFDNCLLKKKEKKIALSFVQMTKNE